VASPGDWYAGHSDGTAAREAACREDYAARDSAASPDEPTRPDAPFVVKACRNYVLNGGPLPKPLSEQQHIPGF
jgi:hypothetical protein